MTPRYYSKFRLNYVLVVLGFMLLAPAAYAAPTIDGDPSDWGPAGFLTGDWSLNGTWVPKPGIWFTVEDNRNPKYPASPVPYTGVHITGVGGMYKFYDEPKVLYKDGVHWVVEPYGSPQEPYDLEAIYFQQDANNVYILVVTSLKEDGTGDSAPGDLRMDINKSKDADGYKYELGVKIGNKTGLKQFGIYDVTDWADTPNYIPSNLPALILNGTLVGTATGKYVSCTACNQGTGIDFGVPIFVIEMSIPKSAIGGAGDYVSSDFSMVDKCTNDQLSIPIPEFATIALPLFGLVGLFVVLRKGRRH